MSKIWKNKRTWLIIVLAVIVIILVGVLVKCVGSKDNETSPGGLGEEVQVEEETDEGGLTINDAEDADTDKENTIDYNSSNTQDEGNTNNTDEEEKPNSSDNGGNTDGQENDNQEQPDEEKPNTKPDATGEFGDIF